MTLSDFHSVGVCWSDDRLGSTDGRFRYPDGGQEGAQGEQRGDEGAHQGSQGHGWCLSRTFFLPKAYHSAYASLKQVYFPKK